MPRSRGEASPEGLISARKQNEQCRQQGGFTMIAPKPIAEAIPQPKVRVFRRTRRSRLSSALTAVVIASTMAVIYTAACAVATDKGYSRTEMYTEFKQLQTQNQLLSAEVRRLEGPDRIASAAANTGMEQKRRPQYLGLNAVPENLAKLRNRVAINPQITP